MRALTRINKPAILQEKETTWLTIILENPEKRPGSHTYRHPKILEALLITSHHKCFYCETLLKGVPKEIDHHIEFEIDRTLAVDWDNLYLACVSCNDKFDHNVISVTEALDPCKNTDDEIQQHLYFENEAILPRNNSELGRRTITKYKLNSLGADYLRAKELQKLNDLVQSILIKCIKESRKPTAMETQKIKNFALIEKSYSLMFIEKLKDIDLISI